MVVNIYLKNKEQYSPKLFENYDEGLYKIVKDIELVKDINTDYDLLRNNKLIERFDKEKFYLVVN